MDTPIRQRALSLYDKVQLMKKCANDWAQNSKTVSERAESMVSSSPGQSDQQAKFLVETLLANVREAVDTVIEVSRCLELVSQTVEASLQQMVNAKAAGNMEEALCAERNAISNFSVVTCMLGTLTGCKKTATESFQHLMSFYEEKRKKERSDIEAARSSMLTAISVFMSMSAQSLAIKGWRLLNKFDTWSFILNLIVIAGSLVSQSVATVAEKKKTFDLVRLLQFLISWVIGCAIILASTSDLNDFAKSVVLVGSFVVMFLLFTFGKLFRVCLVGLWLSKKLLWAVSCEKSCCGI